MGLFDFLFGKRPKPTGQYQDFKMLTGYAPHFSQWGGDAYQNELVRAAIGARATHISKLKVETQGSARRALQAKLKHGPNQFQTWSQFLYRLSTILDMHNTAFITPVFDEFGEPSGIYTPLPNRAKIVQYSGVPYLRYEFTWGQTAAVELEYCGIMTKFQYKNDFFGEDNAALIPTMDLIHIQNQGIQEGVKSAATYRFMAQINNFTNAEDLAKERKRFTAENFARDAEGGGLLLFPSTFDTNGLVVREAAACGLGSLLVRGSCAAASVNSAATAAISVAYASALLRYSASFSRSASHNA